MDTWVASAFGCCDERCCERGCANLPETLISVLWGKYPEAGSLDDVVIVLNFEEPPHCFHRGSSIYIPTNGAQGFRFPHVLTNTCYFWFFSIMAILVGGRWYLQASEARGVWCSSEYSEDHWEAG